jgi:hypothetical protein
MPTANTLNIIVKEQEEILDFADAKERIFDEVQAMQEGDAMQDSDSEEVSDGTGTQVIDRDHQPNIPVGDGDSDGTQETIIIPLEIKVQDADLSLVPEVPELSIGSND